MGLYYESKFFLFKINLNNIQLDFSLKIAFFAKYY
jgi:hypothetical protein